MDRPDDISGPEGPAGKAGHSEPLAERLAEASALADQGEWEEAFALLLSQEEAHPEDATLMCMLGVAARETGSDGMAYDFFRRCLALEPSDPLLLTAAGVGLAAGDDPDAERVLRLAALTAPAVLETRRNYGSFLARQGLLDAAVAELEAARALDAEDPEVRFELGVAYYLAGRAEEGLEELGEALSRGEDDSWEQGLYGLALADAERLEEAAEALHTASLGRVEDWELQAAAALAAAAVDWVDAAWDALARADLSESADRGLLREVEERLELGADAAQAFLREEVAAPMLRLRLLDRG
jgi:Flp pilus assembly protein TadD